MNIDSASPRQDLENARRTPATAQSIPARFAPIAARHADRIAISTTSAQWTYAELDQRSTALAIEILDRWGSPPEPIALLMRSASAMIAAIFAAHKAGRIYLAMDADNDQEQLATLLDDSGAQGLVCDSTTAGLAQVLADDRLRVLCCNEVLAARSISGKLPPVPSETGAWLMYTSGSTGRPKGVWQTHAGVLHLNDVYSEIAGLRPDDRLSLLAPFTLATSTTAMFGALLNGATLCPFHLRSQGVDRLYQWQAKQQISVLHTVPTVFRQTLRSRASTHLNEQLRLVRLGGEAVSLYDVELFRRGCPSRCRMMHSYSSTETGLACALLIDRQTELSEGRVPVGTPVRGTEVTLVNSEGGPAAPGEIGRIASRGAGVAAGYWRPATMPANGFHPAPTPGTHRMFVTADLGRKRCDGMFEWLGRADQQVKIRGRRVDLARVESVLRSLPAVDDAVVIVPNDNADEGRLISYLSASGSRLPTAADIRQRLVARLPGQMIPDQFIVLPRLPMTAGGKLDRRSLPPPGRLGCPPKHAKLHARDWFEKGLATIWSDILTTETIGRTDDFFELGGSSIESARVLARIEDEFGVTLPPSSLAEYSTIERLAAMIGERTVASGGSPLVRLRESGDKPPLFLVHGGKGDVAMFGQLARRIVDRPVFAFQSVGLNGESWPLLSVPSMARRYLAEMKQLNDGRPVVLAGTCMGGLIVFEMAQQLLAAGNPAEHIILIDTDYPAPKGRRLRWSERALDPIRDFGRILRWAILRGSGIGRGKSWLPAYRRFIYSMNGRARRRFKVRPYPGGLTILSADAGVSPGEDLRLRMRSFAQNSTVIVIRGERARLFLPPAVDELAGHLNAIAGDRQGIGYPC